MTLNGIPIRVHGDVSLSLPAGMDFQLTSSDGTPVLGSHPGPKVLVDGTTLDVVGGHLFIGGSDFGAVTAQDVVEITSQGVLVNAEIRTAVR